MKKPLTFKPDQRLASLLRKPGGISVEEAVARAERRVESVRQSCIDALDETIEQVAIEFQGERIEAMFALASELFNISATFGLTELSEATRSFCDLLLSAQGVEGAFRETQFREAVRIHIDAMRTLRRPDLSGDAAARQAVVLGLRKVAEKRKTKPRATAPAADRKQNAGRERFRWRG